MNHHFSSLRWQRQALLALSLLTLTLLSGCASLLPPQEIEIPLSRLQQSVQKKFPYAERYFGLLDVTLSNPVLSTRPAADRLLIALDAQVLPPLMKTPWQGELLVSGVLRIDAARRAVLLTEPRLENIKLDAATGSYTSRLARLGTQLAEDLIGETVLYTFAPDAFVVAGQRFVPTGITTRKDSLVVSFEPAK
ncbi:MAG: DUF1439 domain-containing protein [Oxalobacteraceae bacterium]|nr:DUF1439 domain-containing protein [Oxalobacteraceae bacterium]